MDKEKVKAMANWHLTPDLSRLLVERSAVRKDLGLQLHIAPFEADVEISRLVSKMETVPIIVSLDSDLVCGYDNISKVLKPCRGFFELYERNDVVQKFEFKTPQALQLWASLCGTDYGRNIPALGAVRNRKFLLDAEKQLMETKPAGEIMASDLLDVYLEVAVVKSNIKADFFCRFDVEED